jgi:hypothetical protein
MSKLSEEAYEKMRADIASVREGPYHVDPRALLALIARLVEHLKPDPIGWNGEDMR